MPRPHLVIGEWNVICDRCGFQFKASQLKDEWTGLKVCKECWESRHPQDMLPAPRPETSPPWTRPVPEDGDASPTYISSTIGVQE
jgi:hypothetical protein